jgi:hypothetical protein
LSLPTLRASVGKGRDEHGPNFEPVLSEQSLNRFHLLFLRDRELRPLRPLDLVPICRSVSKRVKDACFELSDVVR